MRKQAAGASCDGKSGRNSGSVERMAVPAPNLVKMRTGLQTAMEFAQRMLGCAIRAHREHLHTGTKADLVVAGRDISTLSESNVVALVVSLTEAAP